jgi:predicted double-glycine peptidase
MYDNNKKIRKLIQTIKIETMKVILEEEGTRHFDTTRTVRPSTRTLNNPAVRNSDLAKIVNVFNYGNETNVSSNDKSVTHPAKVWRFGVRICVLHQKLK